MNVEINVQAFFPETEEIQQFLIKREVTDLQPETLIRAMAAHYGLDDSSASITGLVAGCTMHSGPSGNIAHFTLIDKTHGYGVTQVLAREVY